MSKSLLHRAKLGEFKAFLSNKSIEHRDGRGDYQVLQVLHNGIWMAVYDRHGGDHFTTDRRMDGLVRRFIKSPTTARTDVQPIDVSDWLDFYKKQQAKAIGALKEVSALYEQLREQTTPQPIETAPKRGKNILLSNGRTWRQGYHHDDDGWVGIDLPTHWLPLPSLSGFVSEKLAADTDVEGGREADDLT